MTTPPRCNATTLDGTRCQNRGHCPHHSGQRGRRTQRIDPAILTIGQYEAYDPHAPRSKVKEAEPKPKWPQYADAASWKGKKYEDMTTREYNAMVDELGRSSRELVEAKEVGWGEFFRTLFRRKR